MPTTPASRKGQARAADGVVSGIVLASAPRLLAEHGVDAAHVARDAGLSDSICSRTPATICFSELGRFFLASVAATGDESIPLRLGLLAGPSSLDALGYVAEHSADVHTALRTLRDHLHHFGGAAQISSAGGIAVVDYSFLHSRVPGAMLIGDAGTGNCIGFLRRLCGPAWTPREVRLMRPLPVASSKWRQFVEAPVYFGAESNLVAFAAKWLDQACQGADPQLLQLLHDRVADLDAERDGDFALQVSAVIRAGLLAGDARPDRVARRLAISPRTLRRRLLENGSNYQQLLDETRRDVACQLLQGSAMSMTQIADVLGYAHSSALTRAFRSWTGTSPSEWRTAAIDPQDAATPD